MAFFLTMNIMFGLYLLWTKGFSMFCYATYLQPIFKIDDTTTTTTASTIITIIIKMQPRLERDLKHA